MGADTYLVPKDLHGPWHGVWQNCTHKCRNCTIVHTHLAVARYAWALRSANVECESWRAICISYIPYLVPWSMRLACTGGQNIVRVGRKI